MAFDGIVTKAIASELNLLSGARIDKVFQPNNNNVVLGFYLNGTNYALNVCTSSQNYRVHLTTHPRSNPKVAPNFCMVLRKHLIGLRIKNVITSHLERIITIEDAAELRLKQKHVISLETRLVNYEGTGEVTIRDLVINSLRMRPDRIIVGEVRGKEAFDMLQAMNTGHTGSLTTMHANSPMDALNRLETMILMAGMEIPIPAIREYIENAIHLVVNVERLADGKRKVTSICEVVGFEKDMIQLKEIFAFKQTGLTSNGEVMGEFILHDYVPKVYEQIKAHGIDTLKDIFGQEGKYEQSIWF